ncbi:MAG TPA: class I SAM-dependent methyltransferase [Acidimicrobiales bacterium]
MNPWLEGSAGRGADYDGRFAAREAAGLSVHGEADLVASLAPGSVLDAGCGTGRVAIELSRRGIEVCGIDLDPSMLAQARAKAPGLRWELGDLADPGLDLGRRFDVVVAAGNVMIFLTPGTELAALATIARHVVPGGLVVTGFQLRPGGLAVGDYDAMAAAAGLERLERWSTWERAPFVAGGDYAVSLHRAAVDPSLR